MTTLTTVVFTAVVRSSETSVSTRLHGVTLQKSVIFPLACHVSVRGIPPSPSTKLYTEECRLRTFEKGAGSD